MAVEESGLSSPQLTTIGLTISPWLLESLDADRHKQNLTRSAACRLVWKIVLGDFPEHEKVGCLSGLDERTQYGDANREKVCVSLPKEAKERIAVAAQHQRMPISAWCRRALAGYYETRSS